MEKLHQQLCSPDTHRAFSSYQDVVLRLVPYHVWAEPELPAGAVEKGIVMYSLTSHSTYCYISLPSPQSQLMQCTRELLVYCSQELMD